VSPIEWKGLDFQASGEYVRFRQPALVTGDRSVLYPSMTWSQRGNAWFVSARTGLHMTHYNFDDTTLPEQHLNRVVPISSVDSGLVFERDSNLFGKAFTQTLEPRAYYVYIPYRRQDQIPAFDTAIDDFNFSQLFTENRYLGSDRIGDANQVTLAATTRFLDPQSGEERMRFAAGQRYYYRTQRVTCCCRARGVCRTCGRLPPRSNTTSIIRRPSASTSAFAGSRAPDACSTQATVSSAGRSVRPERSIS
jgi:LPS-assembly protein